MRFMKAAGTPSRRRDGVPSDERYDIGQAYSRLRVMLLTLLLVAAFVVPAGASFASDDPEFHLSVDGPIDVVVEDVEEYQVRLQNVGDVDADVKITFEIEEGSDSIEKLEWFDGSDWHELSFAGGTGTFGPGGGFPAPSGYDATTPIRVTFSDEAGHIKGSIEVEDADDDDTVYASWAIDIVVYRLVLDVDGPTTATAGDTGVEFEITLTNPLSADTDASVRVEFEFDTEKIDTTPIENLEWWCIGSVHPDCDDDEWLPLTTDYFGPASGFPVPGAYSATTKVRADFPAAGEAPVFLSAVGDPTDKRETYATAVHLVTVESGVSTSRSSSSSSSDDDVSESVTTNDDEEVIVTVHDGDADLQNVRHIPVDPDDPDSPTPPSGLSLPFGLFGFEITDIDEGACVDVSIRLPGSAQEYWKFQDGEWFQIDATFDGRTVTFELCDGGTGDASGEANGTIVDPGGPAVRAAFTG